MNTFKLHLSIPITMAMVAMSYLGLAQTNGEMQGDGSGASNVIFTQKYVGIGTNNPFSNLHIHRKDNFSNSATSTLRLSAERLGDKAEWEFSSSSQGRFALGNFDATGFTKTNRFIILEDGKVGIGQPGPTFGLDLGTQLNLLSNNGGVLGGAIYVDGNESMWFNGTYHSWGYGGDYNFFQDGVTIGGPNAPALMPPSQGLRVKGKVGIGMPDGQGDPVELLQLGDRFVFHDGGTKLFGYNFDYVGGNPGSMRLHNGPSSVVAFDQNGDIHLRVVETGNAGTTFGFEEKRTVALKNSGRFGVGTLNPQAKLGVVTENENGIHIYAKNADGIMAYTDQSSGWGYCIRANVNRNDAIGLGVKNYVDNKDVFRVWGDGRVYCTELNVRVSPFPDYVFADDYNLMPITDLEQYIDTYDHLPNIPTANDVASEGMDVGAIQVKMMEKIEELTLYIIDQNKKLEQLQKENNNLEQKVEQLITK